MITDKKRHESLSKSILNLTQLITLSKKEGPRQYDTAPDTFRLSEKLFAGDDSLAGANFCT